MDKKYIFPYIVNVCYIVNAKDEVLLQLKRRGFGKGKWNGPGGKIKSHETPEESVVREVKEETGISIKGPQKMGVLEFVFEDKPEWNNYMHVFICREFFGKPADKGEGELKWFKKEDLPFDKMWEDDRYWTPQVLEGKSVHMRFTLNKDGKLLKYKNL